MRLSESSIWDVQKSFFTSQGIDAWRKNTVPSYVTTNTYIAYAYAKVAEAYIYDQRSNDPGNTDPIYIVELGGGSGRLAFHFLNHFWRDPCDAVSASPQICYVISDISQKNIDFCRSHPQLQAYIDSGKLDFARFDPVTESGFHLQVDHKTLSTATNGLVVIANYFFDVIQQDVFQIKDGLLYEGCMSVPSAANSDLEADYTFEPCTSAYYHNTVWNDLLALYQNHFTEPTALLFPIGGLGCLNNLCQLGKDNWVLLTADKGQSTLGALEGRARPYFARHGDCFSLGVNYHALGYYAKSLGAEPYSMEYPQGSININTFIAADYPHPAFKQAYAQYLKDFSPDDFFMLKKLFDRHISDVSLAEIMAMLRLSHWDFKIFLSAFPRLETLYVDLSREEQAMLMDMLERVRQDYFDIGEGNGVIPSINRLSEAISSTSLASGKEK